jgi:hypothetical protein
MNNQSSWQQAFNLSAGAANQLGRGQQMASDTRSLDELIEKAKSSGDISELEQILGRIEDPQKRQQGAQIMQRKLQDKNIAKQKDALQELKENPYIADLSESQQRIYLANQEKKQQANRQREALQAQGLPEDFYDLPSNVQNQVIKQKQQEVQFANDQAATQVTLDRVKALLPNVGRKNYATSYLPFASTSQKSIAEFGTLMGSFESALKDRVSKGTLSNARFRYIVDDLLPSASDTIPTIEGKLAGIASQLELESIEQGTNKAEKQRVFQKTGTESQPKQSVNPSSRVLIEINGQKGYIDKKDIEEAIKSGGKVVSEA